MRWDYDEGNIDIDISGEGLFIINEGNFQYGNATLSYYNPTTGIVENEIFRKVNGMRLGDVAQSMTIYEDTGWIVMNGSHVVFAIDLKTLKEKGRIENFTSPRYIHFVSPDKAYVTQIWDNRIFIVNPKTYSITGYIEVPGMFAGNGSTEQMVSYGKYVYCNCWSYQSRIIKIDTDSNSVVESLNVGIQPNSLVIDAKNRLWTLCDGGYEGSPYGVGSPSLFCIDAESFTVNRVFEFSRGASPSELCQNGAKTKLFWINDDIWEMDTDAENLPQLPVISSSGTKYYGLTVNPENGDIYVADAIDYMQQGLIKHYSLNGLLLNEFYAGITPGAFCWKLQSLSTKSHNLLP